MYFINIDLGAEMAGINPTGINPNVLWRIMGEMDSSYRKQIILLTLTRLQIKGLNTAGHTVSFCVR